jgi:two-component system chemotaxis response regulator CheB
VTSPARATPTPVIVVDDSPVQRRFVRAAVEADSDFTVVGEARNGKEAVALVARLRPAAVLMDLDLPLMSGIEAIEAIMAASPTPILVYSAHVGGDESANAESSGLPRGSGSSRTHAASCGAARRWPPPPASGSAGTRRWPATAPCTRA